MPPLDRVSDVPVPPLKTERVVVPWTKPPEPVTRRVLGRDSRYALVEILRSVVEAIEAVNAVVDALETVRLEVAELKVKLVEVARVFEAPPNGM